MHGIPAGFVNLTKISYRNHDFLERSVVGATLRAKFKRSFYHSAGDLQLDLRGLAPL
jgi:hypothetical protein